MTVKEIISDIKKRKENDGGIDSVYFVACGGSLASFYPAKYLLSSETTGLKIGYYTSNEFVHVTPKTCGKNSIVICCSLRGTPETAVACQVGKERGASTIALVGSLEIPMAKIADYNIVYGGSQKVTEGNAAISLELAFEILYQFEGYPHYNSAMAAFEKLETVAAQAREYSAPRAKVFAQTYKDEKLIYVMGGGPSMGSAYAFSICSLMEIQWIHAPTVNTGEYFHGPFETTDKNLAIVLLINVGRTRPIDERAQTFVEKYGEKVTIMDAKELGLDLLEPEVREFFNPLVFSRALNVYLNELADIRQHPTSVRRYMWQFPY